MSSSVYLDYNATTPVSPEVLESMTVALRDLWANPSSGHKPGKVLSRLLVTFYFYDILDFSMTGLEAKQCIIQARKSVARMINAAPSGKSR